MSSRPLPVLPRRFTRALYVLPILLLFLAFLTASVAAQPSENGSMCIYCQRHGDCGDYNVCTIDTCEMLSGGPCCVHTPINCDDSNPCTVDTCDPATGCVHTPNSCDDGDDCTVDSCDPSTGCVNTSYTCDDSDPCTTDSCDGAGGCVYAPVNCDDGNPNTADSCAGGVCQHVYLIGRADLRPLCGFAELTVGGGGLYPIIVKVDGQIIYQATHHDGYYKVPYPQWLKDAICQPHQAVLTVDGQAKPPVALGGASCCAPGPVVLQQGRAGYVGVQDTYLNAWDPSKNYQHDGSLRYRTGGQQVSLLRFDLSSLPAGTVKSARLYLFASSIVLNPVEVEAFRVLRFWDIEEATWLRATELTLWAEPGCNGLESDRATEPAASAPIYVDKSLRWYELDVTALAQEWVADPARNYGLLLKGKGNISAGYPFASSDHISKGWRPRLEIVIE